MVKLFIIMITRLCNLLRCFGCKYDDLQMKTCDISSFFLLKTYLIGVSNKYPRNKGLSLYNPVLFTKAGLEGDLIFHRRVSMMLNLLCFPVRIFARGRNNLNTGCNVG